MLGVSDKKTIYVHGDPGKRELNIGIGKSSTFSSLVHNMNSSSEEVKTLLREAFPFLGHFKHFLYISASHCNFSQ